MRIERIAHLRYDGTDTLIEVPLTDIASMTRAFVAAHEQTYSFRLDRPLVVGALTVEAVAAPTTRDDIRSGWRSTTREDIPQWLGCTRRGRGTRCRCTNARRCRPGSR